MKALKIFLSVILSIIFFVAYFAFSNIMIARMALSKNNIEDFIADLKVEEINIGGFLGDTNYIDPDANMNNYLKDYIQNSGIDNETATKIVNNDDFNNIVKNYLADSIIASLYSEKLPRLNSVEIINTLNDNDIKLTAKAENDIQKSISELNEQINFDISKQTIYKHYSVMDVFEIVNCKTVLYISLITIIIFYFIFALINWRFKKPLLYMAIPILISGIIIGVIYVGSNALINFFEFNNYAFILNNMLSKYLYLGIASIIIGIGLIVLNNNIKESKIKEVITS